MESQLRLYLTGRVAVEGPGGVVDVAGIAGRQGAVVLAHLADLGHRVDRHAVAELLWPGPMPEAWDAALSAVVSKLRRAFTAAGVDGRAALPGVHGCYEVRLPAGTWVDLRVAVSQLDASEAALAREDAAKAWTAAAVASTILARPLVPGEQGAWLDRRRRELHALHLRACDAMAGAWLLAGNAPAAVAAARTAVASAPLSEASTARLMECLVAAGDRAAAVDAYQTLAARLRDELGISPDERLRMAYLDVIGG